MNKISPEIGLQRLAESAKGKDLFVISKEWLGTKHSYNFLCKIHGEFETSFDSFCGLNSGCPRCGEEIVGKSNRLTKDEAMSQLKNMGCIVNLNEFNFETTTKPMNGVYFKGRKVKSPLASIKYVFKNTGLPLGFAMGSSEDSWMGFVCQLANKNCEYLSWPFELQGLSFDVYDFESKKACEYNGPRHIPESPIYNKNQALNDIRKVDLSLKAGINLKTFNSKNYPKDKLLSAKAVLDHMYPEKCDSTLLKLQEMLNCNKLIHSYQKWCDEQGLFDRKKNYQKMVLDLIINGKFLNLGKIKKVTNPGSPYFDLEIRNLAIKEGIISPFQSNEHRLRINKSREKNDK